MKNFFFVILANLVLILNNLSYADVLCCHGKKQSRGGAATFTVGSGYDFFSGKRHIENTSIPFVAVGYDFTCNWGIEAFYGFFTTDFKKSVPDDRQIRGSLFAVDILYHFTSTERFEPYVMAGVGITGLNPNRYDANNEGNINVGAGLLYFINEAVALRAEARDFYSTVVAKNDVYLNGGVTFFLDLC